MAEANNITDDHPIPVGDGFLQFGSFEDGWDDDDPRRAHLDQYMHQLELAGKPAISAMIERYAEQNRPVSCLINNPFIPWASDVAESLGIPSAMLWVQSCACFAAYYHYNHGLVKFPTETDPEIDVQLPSMPLLKHDEVPSFLHPSTPFAFLRTAILGQFKKLDKQFCVLMDTFQELEPEIVEYMSKFCLIKTVGPLFKYPEVPNNTIRCDIMKPDDCIEWLDSKPAASVIYISFGTVVYLKQEQVDEIAEALLATGISYLWVMKPPAKESGLPIHTLPEGFLEKVGDNGKVVQWSPQDKVLIHPSVSCFVSHCGWNSTMEALSCGVPIVAFPQWGDQVTNAVYLVDVFKTGVRMGGGEAENRIIPKEEVAKCFVEATVGPKAKDLKRNALKWKAAAEAAMAGGGSSDRNIQAFINEVRRRCTSTDNDAATMNFVNKHSPTEPTVVINALIASALRKAQGHVNPLLRLGKRLASKGLLITLSTPKVFGKQMAKANNITDDQLIPVGDGFLRFESFQDGWDDDDPRRAHLDQYMHQLELAGKPAISAMIKRYAEQNRPVSCLINNPYIPWASDVAESLGIPSAMLWVQSCACFAAYYHYNHGLVPFPTETDPEIDVQLPSMPLLKHDEVPSYLRPSTPFAFLRTAILGQFKKLDKPFCVLIDTFQELEPEIVEYMSKFCLIKTVGPLVKYPEVPNSTIRCDMMKPDDCIEWLDSKPASSVIYISFGTVFYLKQEQVDEIAKALLATGISFLWVMKPPAKEFGLPFHTLPEGFLEKVGDNGKILLWSPQVKVLTHPSISCFMSHCGWNSVLETLSCGVPIIAFPQWGDQVTNAVYLVDVFKTGLRMGRGKGKKGITPKEEVAKCFVEATLGLKAKDLKSNALKWKLAAEEAIADGGSSDRNMQTFIDEVKNRCRAQQ
ncbi:hypothetical protein E1A91_D02G245100v1 [Gossypium mustelinum]|uniref:UDP-glycosyltransferases domain-containing protein n=1 Tax=Gossypium mustelinum TaxID=34275 RepID=A0A5D2W1U2_GOSMU|nr:hypothetical protein E1A91_D02G245100v1 [Gossypium mustelinum]